MFFFFSSRRRHTRCSRDWSSDVCSSDLFTRENDIVTIGSENHFQNVYVKLLSCVDKFISSLLGSVEHLCVHARGYGRGFSGGLLPGDDRVCGQKEEQARDCYCCGEDLET